VTFRGFGLVDADGAEQKTLPAGGVIALRSSKANSGRVTFLLRLLAGVRCGCTPRQLLV
jgi:hypothetical protein